MTSSLISPPMASDDQLWPLITSNDLKWPQMTSNSLNDHKWPKRPPLTSNGLQWPPMTLNDLQWPLTASIDLNVSLFGNIIQITYKTRNYCKNISKSQLLGVEVKCHMFVEAVLKVVGGEVNKLESTQKCCQIPALAWNVIKKKISWMRTDAHHLQHSNCVLEKHENVKKGSICTAWKAKH